MGDLPVVNFIFEFPVRAISKDNEKVFNRSGRFFLSRRFKEFEQTLRDLLEPQLPKNYVILTTPVRVDITFVFKNRVHCDLFNLPKSVCDAFKNVLWKDDRQIKQGFLSVEYGEREMIYLNVCELVGPKSSGNGISLVKVVGDGERQARG